MPHTERGTKTVKETQACSNDKHKHKHKYKRASTDIRPTQRSVASNMLSPAHTETLDIIFFTFRNIQFSGTPNTSSGSIGNSSVTQFVNVAEAWGHCGSSRNSRVVKRGQSVVEVEVAVVIEVVVVIIEVVVVVLVVEALGF